MKHEYTADELAELKSIYDESGEAGLDVTEMRALRTAKTASTKDKRSTARKPPKR